MKKWFSNLLHLRRYVCTRKKRPAQPVRGWLCLELLEDRTLLTSTLYVDFGDRFPNGVLNTTVGDLHSHTYGANPNIDGPTLLDTNQNDYPTGTSVSITSLGNLYGESAPGLRSTMMALVRRFYQGLDLSVIDLSATMQT